MSIRIRFLGTPSIEEQGEQLVGELPSKAVGLLAFLVVERRRFTRDKLAELFWSGDSQARARHNLRQLIRNIKLILPDILELDGRRFVAVNGAVIEWVDVWQMETAVNQQNHPLIAELYRGDFLEGTVLHQADAFEEWQRIQSASFHQNAIQALEALLQQSGNHDAVMCYAPRLIELEPWNEAAYRQLMRSLAHHQRFNQALAIYRQCRASLQAELNLTPSPQTQLTHEKILMARNLVRSELPFTETTFVGREAELAQMEDMLSRPDCRCLTLLGMGGIGKTRLAAEFARRSRHKFLHDVCFVSLSVQDDSIHALQAAMARALGLPATGGILENQLIDYLRLREMLLVLDNFEQLRAASSFLVLLLRKLPDLKLLVTTRERLDIAEEWLFDLAGLPLPADTGLPERNWPDGVGLTAVNARQFAAVALFEQRARQLNAAFVLDGQIQEVVQLCQMVHGVPLGLELLAPWTRTMNCAEIVAQIANNKDTLLQIQRNFNDRHQSLNAVFDSAWQLLEWEARRVMASLTVFRGDFSWEAAVYVANTTKTALDDLAGRSLLQKRGNGRYAIHELLRQYAANKLTTLNTPPSLLRQHCHYYIRWAQRVQPSLKGAQRLNTLRLCEHEFGNMRAAWLWGIDNLPAKDLLPLAEHLFWICYLRNWYETGISLFSAAVQFHSALSREVLHARILAYEGMFQQRLGRYEIALQCGQSAQLLALRAEDEIGIARAQALLGSVYYDMGQYNEAESHLLPSLELSRANGDDEGIAFNLYQLGLIISLRADWSGEKKRPYKPPAPFIVEHYDPSPAKQKASETARDYFQEAIQINQRSGDLLGEALCTHCIGFTWYQVKGYDTAVTHFQKAAELLSQMRAASDLTQSLNWLAWAYFWQGDIAQARRHFLQALKIGLEASATKRLLDCLQKFALFLWSVERDHFTSLAIVAHAAQSPYSDARIRVSAEEWMANIRSFMADGQAKEAILHGQQQTLPNLIHTILAQLDESAAG